MRLAWALAVGLCDATPLELGVERIFGVSSEGDCLLDDAELFEMIWPRRAISA